MNTRHAMVQIKLQWNVLTEANADFHPTRDSMHSIYKNKNSYQKTTTITEATPTAAALEAAAEEANVKAINKVKQTR